MIRLPRSPQTRPNILVGILRVALGRKDGLGQFGTTQQAFLASLAPLIAFPLVGGVLMMMQGAGRQALTDLLATACALLAPPALSFELARLWGREAHWLRFATAFNWCQWILPLVGSVFLFALGIAVTAGLSEDNASIILIVCLGCYALWLHWFLARHGLDLPAGRAALLVAGVNLITVLLVLGPRLLAFGR
jgi:hypothetical protein